MISPLAAQECHGEMQDRDCLAWNTTPDGEYHPG